MIQQDEDQIIELIQKNTIIKNFNTFKNKK